MVSRKKIEESLGKMGKALTKATSAEKAEHGSSCRWRVHDLARDGYHGFAGGEYFETLADVGIWLEGQEISSVM